MQHSVELDACLQDFNSSTLSQTSCLKISLLKVYLWLFDREARIAEVKSGIQRYEAMLRTMNLPDGGARILARISEQRRQLDDIIAEGAGSPHYSVTPHRPE